MIRVVFSRDAQRIGLLTGFPSFTLSPIHHTDQTILPQPDTILLVTPTSYQTLKREAARKRVGAPHIVILTPAILGARSRNLPGGESAPAAL